MNAGIEFERVRALLLRMPPLPPDAVIAGSWVLPFYRESLGRPTISVVTLDIDIAMWGAHQNLSEQRQFVLAAEHTLVELGFQEEIHGTGYIGEEFSVFRSPVPGLPRIEVLVQFPGGGKRRPTARARYPTGIRPMVIDRIEVLFVSPWEHPIGPGRSIRIPNPYAFVVQKALTRAARGPLYRHKRLGDAAAILETALLFGNHDERLYGLAETIRSTHPKRAASGRDIIEGAFLRKGSPTIREALSAISPDSRATEQQAVQAIRAFLDACEVSA